MDLLAQLIRKISFTTNEDEKIKQLVYYFTYAGDQDTICFLNLFLFQNVKRIISIQELKNLVLELTQLPEWIFFDSYMITKELSETIHLILPNPSQIKKVSLHECIHEMANLANRKEAFIFHYFDILEKSARYIFIKLITGQIRIPVSSQIIIRALALHTGLPHLEVSLILDKQQRPFKDSFYTIFNAASAEIKSADLPVYSIPNLRSYDSPQDDHGESQHWIAVYKPHGIHCQLVYSGSKFFLLSEDQDSLISLFPEFAELTLDTDGEFVLLGFILLLNEDGIPDNEIIFHWKDPTKAGKRNRKDFKSVFIAYDIPILNGKKLDHENYAKRYSRILDLIMELQAASLLSVEDYFHFQSWEELKEMGFTNFKSWHEGILLIPNILSTPLNSHWVLNKEPRMFYGILIYVERLFIAPNSLEDQFTFAVWKNELLVPVARTSVCLELKEREELFEFIKQNTVERFGPVRSVKPELVFQISYTHVLKSSRHKSGILLQSPTVIQWCRDVTVSVANHLADFHP
ncbi:MAG: hypothetical protein M3Q56_13035 [Bacteroidota bacterium]|nr:hypothetical protein [Bacteroidota bacterium]